MVNRAHSGQYFRCCLRYCYQGLAASLALSCAGCWEEIRYDPTKTPPVKSATTAPAPSTSVGFDQSEPAGVGTLDRGEFTDGLPLKTRGVPETEDPTPPRTAWAAWQLASKWSFAAALSAKGLEGTERFGKNMAEASDAAAMLAIGLPELPKNIPGENREKRLIVFLLEEGGPDLRTQLLERYDARHAALAELAVKTNLLLLTYTPKSRRVESLLAAVRRAAEDSALPADVWQEVVARLEERAEWTFVKPAIYRLHRLAPHELGGRSIR